MFIFTIEVLDVDDFRDRDRDRLRDDVRDGMAELMQKLDIEYAGVSVAASHLMTRKDGVTPALNDGP